MLGNLKGVLLHMQPLHSNLELVAAYPEILKWSGLRHADVFLVKQLHHNDALIHIQTPNVRQASERIQRGPVHYIPYPGDKRPGVHHFAYVLSQYKCST